MGHVRSTCGIICILFLLWAEKIQCPAVNTLPESNFCVLRTQKGVDIRASLKPSLNARHNLHQTLDLTNARCCFNPDKKCSLTEHLNVTLNNITSLLKYPIQPLWMLVNNKRIPHLVVWDELWYSFYEFGEPSLTQTVDVQITRTTSSNTKEAFAFQLSSEKSTSPTIHTETSARLVMSPQRSPLLGEDRIVTEEVFLLIPEVTGNMKKDSQTRRGPRDYLVLNQSLFEFPSSYCFNEKTGFLSLVDLQHRPCVEAFSVDLEKQTYDFYIKTKVKEIRNESTECFLSSFGTLYDTETTSHHPSSVIFIFQQPLILHIFIPNEKPSSRSAAAEVLNTVYFTITLHTRHLGSFLNDQCSLVIATIRDTYGIIHEHFDTLYSNRLGPFFKDQFTIVTAFIHDGYDVIAQNLQILAMLLKVQWSSALDVLYSTAEQLCNIFVSFDKFDRISFEKSIDYQWNLIWSYIDHACQKIGVLRAKGDATVAVGWIAFSIFIAFPLLTVKWLVTSLRNPANVQEMDDFIIMANDSGTFVFGEEDLLADFLQDIVNMMYLPPWASEDETIVDGTNTTMSRQDTVPRASFGIPLTQSDHGLATDNAYTDDEDCTSLRLTVSDACISYNLETGRSISSRGGSEYDVIGSVETSRDLSLVKAKYRPASLQPFSFPYINFLAAAKEYQRNADYASDVRIGSSCDLMPVTHRETKTRVENPPTGKLASHSKHSRGEPSEEQDEGRDVEEANKIYMAQRDSAPNMSHEKKDLKQSMKHSLTDIGETNGSSSQLRAIHLVKQEPSEGHDEDRDMEEPHKIYLDPKSSPFKVPQKVKDLIQSMKHSTADIDQSQSPPSQLRAIHLVNQEPSEGHDEDRDMDEPHKIYLDPNSSPFKMPQKVKDLIQSMKHSIADIDQPQGPPSQLRAIHLVNQEPSEEHDKHRDVEEARKFYMASNSSAFRLSREDKSTKHFLSDINETNGPPSQLRAIHLVEGNPSGRQDEGTYLDKALEENDPDQAMKDFLAKIEERYHGNNRTPLRRFTNFIWQCQDVVFDVLRIYMDNGSY